MEICPLSQAFSVCRLPALPGPAAPEGIWFLARTDEEISLVCETRAVPADALAREDGWRAFRVAGVLDFSLVGVLARITAALAERGIGLFAVSTFNTDYVLVRSANLAAALDALRAAGYRIAG